MRERVEDLGRLAVLIKNIIDHELFEERPCRNKDYCQWFSELTEEKKDEIIHNTVYSIDNVNEKLYEMLEIAEGKDLLNDTDRD